VYSAFGMGLVRLQLGFKHNPDSCAESLLEAILLALNPVEPPTVPPVQEGPNETDITLALFYAGSLLCFLAALLATWAKWYLSSYLLHKGESLIERCQDRQRKFDALKKWRFDLCLKSPMVMVLIALPLLICGLCQRMCFLDPSVLYILILLAVPGVVIGSPFVTSPSEFAARPRDFSPTSFSKARKESTTS